MRNYEYKNLNEFFPLWKYNNSTLKISIIFLKTSLKTSKN